MKIGIATDHRGIAKKSKIIEYIKKLGYEVIDYGTNSEISVDYPEYAFKIAKSILKNEIDLGILICATGTGMTIACNRVKGIRCAKVSSVKESILSKTHNNANVISLNNSMPLFKIKLILKKFIETPFSNEARHIKRIEQIEEYEN